MKNPLVVIAGPTATGKTGVGVALAKKINGEIISADSMQVYKYMDIGTAKATYEEMKGIKHHLIDELFPDDEFNAMVFQKMAKNALSDIYSKEKIPILVGGTGFYINALVYDNDFMLTNEARNNDIPSYPKEGRIVDKNQLYETLKEIDPVSAEKIHPNNIKRVMRAVEFFQLTGKRLSEHNAEEKQKKSPYNLAFVILHMQREKLYEKIDLRVDKMIEAGLIEEVKKLLEKYPPSLVSMQGLGYKELIPYINGEVSLEKAVYDIKKGSRNFAKRQLTWFRNQTNGLWIDVFGKTHEETATEIMAYMKSLNLI